MYTLVQWKIIQHIGVIGKRVYEPHLDYYRSLDPAILHLLDPKDCSKYEIIWGSQYNDLVF